MNQKIKDAVTASFIADALSLGVHWVYDTAAIDKKYGRLDTMVKPELAPYHASREKGAFTHYGDQMLTLLESLSQSSGFDLVHFSNSWQHMFISYDGYMDHATKETLDNFKSGGTPENSGSMSQDLGGAARFVPISLYYSDDEPVYIEASKAQTAMTHNEPLVTGCAELFARTSMYVLKGTAPVTALQKSLEAMPDFPELHQMVNDGIDSRSEDTRQVITQFGQMCSAKNALPGTIHLIAKYEENLEDAFIENIMAGGDSSARGILTGFILGSYLGLEKIPDIWLKDMKAYQKILSYMD